MGDLTKILDGNVGEVKDALVGLSHVDLQALRKEEVAGKNRTGVLGAIDDALAGDQSGGTADAATGAGHADNGIAPADTIDTSGAPQQIVPDVDMTHPAVDADPRAHTTETQNRIDFNDPTKDGREVVEAALKDQGAA